MNNARSLCVNNCYKSSTTSDILSQFHINSPSLNHSLRCQFFCVRKMKPLKFNKLLLTWLSMCPLDESARRTTKLAHIGAASTIFVLCICCLISNIIYVIFITTDLKEGIFTCMNISAFGSMVYTLMNAFSLRYKFNGIFEKLTEICDGSEWISFSVQFKIKIIIHYI